MGPVYFVLVSWRVVIFFVGTRAGELNGVASWAIVVQKARRRLLINSLPLFGERVPLSTGLQKEAEMSTISVT